MKLRDLVAGVEPLRIRGDVDCEIGSLTADSRQVAPGALFFALPGSRTDGRRFVVEAVERGAVAVAAGQALDVPPGVTFLEAAEIHAAMSAIAASFFGMPSRELELIGITGTNGKTTVTYLLEAIWRAAGRTPGVIGTINYRLGDRSWPAPFTTPQAIELQSLLSEMRRGGAQTVAMEVSSHALALDRVRDCHWNGAVFTNLSRDHLDFHADMESYFAAKARLFLDLLPRSAKSDRFAVIHRDDPFGQRLMGEARDRVVTFGRGAEADVAPLGVVGGLDGWRGEIRLGGERIALRSPLVGEAHLENILASAAVGWAQGIPGEMIARGIEACAGVPGRMERVDEGAPFAVIVDYAHTPDALERTVKALRDLAEGRLVVVFGCGGDRDRGKRPLMGEIAARLSDLVVLTSDNPRTEEPYRILDQIEKGVLEAGLDRIDEAGVRAGQSGGYVVIEDRRRAIRFAIEVARPTDVVVIAGKGHEPYQIVGTVRHSFDDREEARQCLAGVMPA